MAKDYQLECERLKGELKRVESERDMWKRMVEARQERDEKLVNSFKSLLIDVLGR